MIRAAILPSMLLFALGVSHPAVRAAVPDPGERTLLPWEAPALLAGAPVLGPVDPAAPMDRLILVLKAPQGTRERLRQFLADLQDPGSPSYHQWLTPAQFGERFGPSATDLEAVTGWLRQEGFSIDHVAQSRMSIVFSGDVARVQRAFRTAIASFQLRGLVRQGSTVAPSVPRFLADRVEGLVSLHDVPRRAQNTGFRRLPRQRDFSLLGLHLLTPGDFATIYNTRPLTSEGIDGAGVSIAVIGRTHIPLSDVATFRWLYGLPAHPATLVVHGPDPGDQGSDENGEANLDVEWSGAVAPMADIKLVVAKSTSTTDGVDLAARHVVDQNLAPVMSLSFGECEKDLGQAGVAFYRDLWAQAAAQGITVVAASGDSGAAGCDGGSANAGKGYGVSGLATTPDNLAVGGTQFADGTGSYWDFWDHKGGASAKSYIPEAAWNESGSLLLGRGIWATGGGPSPAHAKPEWQKAPGVPADGCRDIPDVSLAAAMANGYLVQTGGWPSVVGGTSCAAPALAGIMALVVQTAGRQGNLNPLLYRLATAQHAGTGAKVFHDVVQGNNDVPGTPGYACTPGYDLATGLGSVDAKALLDTLQGTVLYANSRSGRAPAR
ncbi:MAG: S53 family peptidase [Holophaga sp.]|nr:S53 family peptidase [Holophaga sp.]